MRPSDPTTPYGAKDTAHSASDEPTAKLVRKLDESDQPVIKEIALGGTVPRDEPIPSSAVDSGDIYIRLEGRIYGPFTAEEMEDVLESGNLTGLEAASSDLHRWTPLAYHPRMVRRRVRDFDKAHKALREMSALPAKKSFDLEVPLAAIVKRPQRPNAKPGVTAPGIKHPAPPKEVPSPSSNDT